MASNEADESFLLAGEFPRQFLPPGFPPFELEARIRLPVDRRNLAVFGDVDYWIGDRWTLNAGVRLAEERYRAVNIGSVRRTSDAGDFFNGIVDGFLPDELSGAGDNDTSILLPRFGVVYAAGGAVSLGVSMRRGYRSGGTTINLGVADTRPFEPEVAWNYETSLRSRWLQDRLSIDVTAFYLDWTNQQVSIGTGGGTFTENAGASHLYGLELEAAYRPRSTDLTLHAALGLVRSEFDTFLIGETDFSGNELPDSPNVTANAGATFRPGSGLLISADASYTGEAFSQPSNSEGSIVEAYSLVNLKLGYEARRWALYGEASNLLDEQYLREAFDFGGVRFGRVGDPRVVRVVLETTW